MQILTALPDLRRFRASLAGTLGLVPTGGRLHAGPLGLVAQARAGCDHVAVSLTPLPGAPALAPGELEQDLQALRPLRVDLVWAPAPADLFASDFQTWVTVERLSPPLEGKHRPGRFRHLATLLVKLLNACAPQRLYLGQKHAQQVALVRQLVRDLDSPVEVVVGPTLREADGLALSRANGQLGPAERRAAPVLYRALLAARARYVAGEREADMLRAAMSATLAGEPLAREEYVSAAEPDTLAELERVQARVLLSLAVHIGPTRLIDCLQLPDPA